jgi:hypothetical protein
LFKGGKLPVAYRASRLRTEHQYSRNDLRRGLRLCPLGGHKSLGDTIPASLRKRNQPKGMLGLVGLHWQRLSDQGCASDRSDLENGRVARNESGAVLRAMWE